MEEVVVKSERLVDVTIGAAVVVAEVEEREVVIALTVDGATVVV